MTEAVLHLPIANAILSALRDPGFTAGVAFGVLALSIGAVADLVRRGHAREVVAPLGGLCFVAAVLAALVRTDRLSGGLVLGVAALVGAGALASVVPHRVPGRAVIGPALAVPGAWMVVHAEPISEIGWIQGLLGVCIVVGAALTSDFDRRWRRVGAGPVLLAISLFGVYATVPDTEQALVLLGASLPLALPGLIGRPRALDALGAAGAYGAVGLLVWSVGAGGAARHSAIVGGLACLALLVVEPIGRSLARGPSRVMGAMPDSRIGALTALAAGQLALVYVCSRVAGLRDTVTAAALIAGAALLVGVAVLGLGGPTSSTHHRTEGVRA